MGRLSQPYSLEQVEQALRSLGETPIWSSLPRALRQHKCVNFKAFVNVWPGGTVLVQGGEAPKLEQALKERLGEAIEDREPQAEGGPAWHLFVDGSCPVNKLAGKVPTAAGWGIAVYRFDQRPAEIFVELFGPVVTEAVSPLSLGAMCGSNNTGELSAMAEDASRAALRLRVSRLYVANIVLGRNRAHKNVELAQKLQGLYAEVQASRPVRLSHVKGHSGCAGNERADQLAAQGTEGRFSLQSKRWAKHAEAAEAAGLANKACVITVKVEKGRRPPTPATGRAKKARRLALADPGDAESSPGVAPVL
ncbi:Ribonuclease H (RNase H) [Durusdinium trenchii]|uniref:Ribonuclease H (RNase H) n=1 Tax=Durusdinium trenchii TaxID=1381693 RepID=A0ABP0JTV4_9DINO